MAITSFTIEFATCTPAPVNGYNVQWRIAGESGGYTDAGNFTGSPAVITVDQPFGTGFEGFIRSDCGDGTFGAQVPWSVDTCCSPSAVAASDEVLSEFWFTEEIEVETTVSASLTGFGTADGTGWVDWGDGTIEPFTLSPFGVLSIGHNFSAGTFTYKLFFDDNDLSVLLSTYDGKVLLSFTHSDAFTGFGQYSTAGVMDINNILPPAATNMNSLIMIGSVLSVQTSMDFSSMPASVTSLQVNDFPLLDYITGIANTVNGLFVINSNPSLAQIDNTIQGTSISVVGNLDGILLGTIDFSTATLCNLKQDFDITFVNAALVALDANGINNGNADLRQVPTATPTGAGATAKTNLIGKGWTVNTD